MTTTNVVLNDFAPQREIHQVSEYFNIIEHSVSLGDTNRRYSNSNNPSIPGGDIREGNYVTFTLSPTGENITDLANTKIRSTLILKVKVSAAMPLLSTGGFPAGDYHKPAFWVGYKEGVHAVSAYDLLANGRVIYTQNFAMNETYITSCAATQAVKEDDTFSRAIHEQVWNRVDTVRAGCIFDGGTTTAVAAGSEQELEIPISFALKRILPLDSIRFLPAFFGSFQIRIRFSTDALQVTPLSVEDCLQNAANIGKLASYPKLTNKFVPFEEQFTMLNGLTFASGAFTATTMTQQLEKHSAVFRNSSVIMNCLSLDENVYTNLVERYKQVALSFPVKTMDWTTMEGALPTTTTAPSTLTTSITPKFVNSIFILAKKKQNYSCNYDNPMWKDVQLTMGAYGKMPMEAAATNEDIIKDLCANALNTNNDIAGFNLAVSRSFSATEIQATGYRSNDTTNFFLGFPTETDFTFQQGQTSNSPINYKLVVQNTDKTGQFLEKPEFGVLNHRCLSVQLRDNGPPVITLDDYNLSAAQDQ